MRNSLKKQLPVLDSNFLYRFNTESPMRMVHAAVLIACVVLAAGNLSAQNAADPYATSGYATPGAGYGLPATNIFTFPPAWLTASRSAGGSSGYTGIPSVGSLIGVKPANCLWLRGEYLHWWTEGMQTPALATTSPDGTAQDEAGVLGFDNTTVLFGGGKINDDSTSGIRLKGGFFLTSTAAFGIEGEYFSLKEHNDGFSGGTGRQILARPFYDTDADQQTSQLIDYPGLVDGSLGIGSDSDLTSYLIAGRASLCPTCGGNCVACRNTDRVDWIVGYRHIRLEDGLSFSENLESLDPAAPGTIQLSDHFRTTNEFDGLQLGVAYQANLTRIWLESLLRVAVGRNTQTVSIGGQSAVTELGVTENYSGGLLAQRFNSGSYERDELTMIPEIGLTLGVRIFDWMHATAGYTLVYLPAVVRAGDQIDTDINPNLLAPPIDPLTGSRRPEFRYVESDYYAQGLSLGLQLQF
ncbi:BBP7 family outer membrane beta-barrel protein [Aporhodopirellula aestuarii]|uniref:BBP7 family outer membrane beta-barrel protein n=1 Tax=Aporhodopirellula aestuarii TaxID=2950107 RepID=A0ABT0UB76_9BACT|nr:BBP7 family outer membrane beta-barrel protein [Aporhodopirellula aestuarii]MCM2374262.1 BBP7 family outer membrane beta-barrel protein [Aporhodopirellula aestuarii]